MAQPLGPLIRKSVSLAFTKKLNEPSVRRPGLRANAAPWRHFQSENEHEKRRRRQTQEADPSKVGLRIFSIFVSASLVEVDEDVVCVWKKSPEAESIAIIVSGEMSLCCVKGYQIVL